MAPEANRRTFRFKPAHDVVLLREIARQRPWTAAHGETLTSWESIGAAFNTQLTVLRPSGPMIDPKACQRRYKALIDAFLSGDLASLRSTGSAEEVIEREQLIADLHQMAKEYRSERGERRQSRGSVETEGHDSPLPDVSLPTLAVAPAPTGGAHVPIKRGLEQNGSPVISSKKPRTIFPTAGEGSAPSNNAAWDFLQRHLQDESARRQQDLRLAEQKLELEKQRFEMEKRERESHVTMMNAQLELIKQLVLQLQQHQDH